MREPVNPPVKDRQSEFDQVKVAAVIQATGLLTAVAISQWLPAAHFFTVSLVKAPTHTHAVDLQVLKSDALNKDREVLGTEVGIVDAMRFQGVALYHPLLYVTQSCVSR